MLKSIVSHVLSSIPFWRHTDGNRLQMASNHHVQALPLTNPDIPYLYSPYQSLGKYTLIRAPEDGKIIDVVDDVIVFEGNLSGQKLIPVPYWHDILVEPGETVEHGQVIAKPSNVMENGFILQGRNADVAFNIYDGFTFNDPIVGDSSIVYDYESWYPKIIKIELKTDQYLEFYQRMEQGLTIKGRVASIKSRKLVEKTVEDIIFEEPFKIDTLVALVPKNLNLSVFPEPYQKFLKKYDVRYKYALSKQVVQLHYSQIDPDPSIVTIVLFGRKLLKTKVGDKFTNRHANKGVISLITDIEPTRDLPVNFKPQFIFNSHGIRRMNLGQLIEMHYAFILKHIIPLLVKKARRKYDDETVIDKTLRTFVLSVDEQAYKHFTDKVLKCTTPKALLDHIEKYGLHVPIYNYEEADYYRKVVKLFKSLKLPDKILIQESKIASYGVMYIHKLEHVVDNKITAVAVEGHGQRIGEQEVWALLVSQQIPFLEEIMIRADDVNAHLQLIEDITRWGQETKPLTDYTKEADIISEFKSYLTALGIPTIEPDEKVESYHEWFNTLENPEEFVQRMRFKNRKSAGRKGTKKKRKNG